MPIFPKKRVVWIDRRFALGYAAYRSDFPAVASLNLLPEVCRGSSLRHRNFDALVVGLRFGRDVDMEV
ncbi:MAG TPA: hypothetical protein PKE16_11060 [Hyphomicrobium sp.]|nr:hypothetical protein [Hyphomicrobium sp.]